MEKVITNYEGQNEDEISTTAKSAITGLTGNAGFTFATQLSDVVAAEADYVTKQGEVATGVKNAVTVKDVTTLGFGSYIWLSEQELSFSCRQTEQPWQPHFQYLFVVRHTK